MEPLRDAQVKELCLPEWINTIVLGVGSLPPERIPDKAGLFFLPPMHVSLGPRFKTDTARWSALDVTTGS